MPQDETPQPLVEFFEALIPGESGDAPCAAHQACRCVAERGLEAARRLAGLERENAQLKDKALKLQRQVNRLCDIVEMNALERRLQTAAGASTTEPAPIPAAPSLEESEAAAPVRDEAAAVE